MKSLLFVTMFLLASFAHAQESSTSSASFDPVQYETTMRALLEKSNEPGAARGRIGLEFADRYNVIVKQYPDNVQQIETITKSVADEYGLTYEIEKGIITTARFASISSKKVQPTIPNENKTTVPEEVKMDEPSIPDVNNTAVPQEIFKVVEQMPRFPGCEDLDGNNEEKMDCSQKLMLDYIYRNVQYPAEAKAAGIEGRVVVQFIIERNGELTDVRIARDIGYGCGEEAVRVVNLMNSMDEKWIPGKQRGKPVRVQFTLPIQFKL